MHKVDLIFIFNDIIFLYLTGVPIWCQIIWVLQQNACFWILFMNMRFLEFGIISNRFQMMFDIVC